MDDIIIDRVKIWKVLGIMLRTSPIQWHHAMANLSKFILTRAVSYNQASFGAPLTSLRLASNQTTN